MALAGLLFVLFLNYEPITMADRPDLEASLVDVREHAQGNLSVVGWPEFKDNARRLGQRFVENMQPVKICKDPATSRTQCVYAGACYIIHAIPKLVGEADFFKHVSLNFDSLMQMAPSYQSSTNYFSISKMLGLVGSGFDTLIDKIPNALNFICANGLLEGSCPGMSVGVMLAMIAGMVGIALLLPYLILGILTAMAAAGIPVATTSVGAVLTGGTVSAVVAGEAARRVVSCMECIFLCILGKFTNFLCQYLSKPESWNSLLDFLWSATPSAEDLGTWTFGSETYAGDQRTLCFLKLFDNPAGTVMTAVTATHWAYQVFVPDRVKQKINDIGNRVLEDTGITALLTTAKSLRPGSGYYIDPGTGHVKDYRGNTVDEFELIAGPRQSYAAVADPLVACASLNCGGRCQVSSRIKPGCEPFVNCVKGLCQLASCGTPSCR
eukprot:TRINITY_DN34300_c0_g1_i1.p1 TRINITY_DN34300_c0_g1~~TRINITY_DN34300_c0_g1_i1.p1  ORF type:complete len:461 (+),score=56.88 TRINITY_DN34300_c0_g1_i1:71-1384(+)